MIQYPNINPVILQINDVLQIRWYGVMYLLAFTIAWVLLRQRTKNWAGWENTDRLNDLIFYSAVGVVLGGRLGYMLFYGWAEWLHAPLSVFKIWQGGMSFHGGLIGVLLSLYLFSRHCQQPFLLISDLVAPVVPLALACGRMGNFINGELWGKITNVPWAMAFPHAGPYPRHPSSLYGVLLEGAALFIVLWFYLRKPRSLGRASGIFLLGYGLIRIGEEFFRQPDPQYGYLAFGWLTMGQLLCVPMLLLGAFLVTTRSFIR